MSVTVGVKATISKSSYSGSAVTCFPDVCTTPGGPAVPLPAPYAPGSAPAKTASSSATKAVPIATKVPFTGAVSSLAKPADFIIMGAPTVMVEMGTMSVMGSPASSNAASAAGDLRIRLGNLHGQLLGMPPGNPNAWHAALDAYVQTAAQLYVVLNAK